MWLHLWQTVETIQHFTSFLSVSWLTLRMKLALVLTAGCCQLFPCPHFHLHLHSKAKRVTYLIYSPLSKSSWYLLVGPALCYLSPWRLPATSRLSTHSAFTAISVSMFEALLRHPHAPASGCLVYRVVRCNSLCCFFLVCQITVPAEYCELLWSCTLIAATVNAVTIAKEWNYS